MIATIKNRIRPIKKLVQPMLLSSTEKQKIKESKLLEQLYENLCRNPVTKKRVDQILAVNEDDPRLEGVLTEDERALPGNQNFLESGWYKSMLTRYAFAMHYSRGKRVLDTCSGLGWGAYLLETSTDNLICIELDKAAITASRELWNYEKCEFIQGSVLELPFADHSFDVVTAMESVEHFTLADARIYLKEMHRVLKPRGRLIGSTPLPLTEAGVRQELETNPYHLHVFTPSTLREFLSERFSQVTVLHNNRFFWAIKG